MLSHGNISIKTAILNNNAVIIISDFNTAQ